MHSQKTEISEERVLKTDTFLSWINPVQLEDTSPQEKQRVSVILVTLVTGPPGFTSDLFSLSKTCFSTRGVLQVAVGGGKEGSLLCSTLRSMMCDYQSINRSIK